jgi:putative ABC transport system ATP-binding protein
MIELEDVTKTYYMAETRYEALKGISFKIGTGELLAIMGPSGSGKTTLMNILGLMDKPTEGHYRLDGIETKLLSNNELAQLRNQKIGFVFQYFFLLPRLSALQNVGLPLLYAGEKRKNIRTRALEMLKKVEMERYAEHNPNELSGGQRQRVAIARALICRPHMILADEPTGALDTKTTDIVMDLLVHQAKETTVIIVTHNPDVAKYCPRIIEIRDGLIKRDQYQEVSS